MRVIKAKTEQKNKISKDRTTNLGKKDVLFLLLSGIITAAAFPPLWFESVAYIGLVPLIRVLEEKDQKRAFWAGVLFGFVFHLGTVYWIGNITPPGALGTIVVLSFYMGILTLAFKRVQGKFGLPVAWASFPFLWVTMEYLRSLGQISFPWTNLGNSQSRYILLIQYVSFTSVFGVSFWIVTLNVLFNTLLHTIENRRRVVVPIIALLLLFVAPLFYGLSVVPKKESNKGINVSVIQPNILPEVKWDQTYIDSTFEILGSMTKQTLHSRPDLVIWPETAAPCYIRFMPKYLAYMYWLVDSSKTPILTGVPDYDLETKESFNSVFLFLPQDREIQDYRKIHLVPFGEKVPFSEYFPILKRIHLKGGGFEAGDFTSGKEAKLLRHPKVKIGTLICFESIFPDLVRKFAARGAGLLVNITNDAWFGRTSAPFQHAQIAVFRAIENRISIARCANTGVSMFIDPYGRTYQKTPIFKSGIITENLPIRKEETFFTRYGNLFSWVVTFSGLGLFIATFFKRRL